MHKNGEADTRVFERFQYIGVRCATDTGDDANTQRHERQTDCAVGVVKFFKFELFDDCFALGDQITEGEARVNFRNLETESAVA